MVRVLKYNVPIMNKNVRLENLLKKYLSKEYTSEELQELKILLENTDDAELEECYEILPEISDLYFPNSIKSKIFNEILTDFRIKSSLRKGKIYIAKKFLIAASVLCLITIGVSLYFYSSQPNTPNENPYLVDITPGYDQAKVITDEGKVIYLDSVSITKGLERKLDKSGKFYFKYLLANKTSDHKLHTITTPKGGQLTLELPDGSRLWMNAESTIKFSNGFINECREVIAEGEVYFDVKELYKQGKKVPFKVITKDQQIEVLGTAFNVNSYRPQIITTLVKGKVKIIDKAKHEITLKPNQQAILTNDFYVNDVDPSFAIAWKDGDFAYYKANIEEIMLDISRWYNVDIEYKGNFDNDIFTGTISRFENIDKLLNTLELTGSFNLKREGRKIIVQKSEL